MHQDLSHHQSAHCSDLSPTLEKAGLDIDVEGDIGGDGHHIHG